MRNPKKGGAKPTPKAAASKSGSGSKAKKSKPELMDMDGPSTSASQRVWRPGVDPVEDDEELDYDPTAYDCLHRLQLDWPCLSFDIVKDDLGGPRSTFPHTLSLVAGTQAASAKQNYVAFVTLANLGQGRHGKKQKAEGEESDDEDESMDDSEQGSDEEEEEEQVEVDLVHSPPRMHFRMINHVGGINRVRSCPQQPALVAVWSDSAMVRIYDGSKLLKDMAAEKESTAKNKGRVDLKPVAQHSHAMEGFAMDWSPVKQGRLATGDCRKNICVWEPQAGGTWQVSGAYAGHQGSVEDLQWSPTEETVFVSASVDKTIRVWDTRERSKPMITVEAHDSDVNVISWNRLVAYMLASGSDDGGLKIWDLRSFTSDGPVSVFNFHRGPVTSVEWSPYEGSMLASTGADNQLAVWDLALERDPEEEQALAPEGNALAPEDLPAQLLFLHAGQSDLKEAHWHPQIPGMIGSTAGDGFNVFKPSNL